jgi:hypothetical protein
VSSTIPRLQLLACRYTYISSALPSYFVPSRPQSCDRFQKIIPHINQELKPARTKPQILPSSVFTTGRPNQIQPKPLHWTRHCISSGGANGTLFLLCNSILHSTSESSRGCYIVLAKRKASSLHLHCLLPWLWSSFLYSAVPFHGLHTLAKRETYRHRVSTCTTINLSRSNFALSRSLSCWRATTTRAFKCLYGSRVHLSSIRDRRGRQRRQYQSRTGA